MKEVINEFINRVREKDALQKLMMNRVLTVSFNNEQELCYLMVDNNLLKIVSGLDCDSHVIIEGSEDDLKELLYGEDFLLSMKKREDLKVKGKLKDLLLIESLFYLANTSDRKGRKHVDSKIG
ncbi:hypothetical protein LGQ02_17410 [Bacillus shivajii]|uniref:hypothetical protein n=1 Tax=Bacillus shivajii TaxID=1983719 RepID=UPI001CFB6EB0|nr:hypothetical protein [Bacillus shivajii]UCZ52571.1 hypothetical protein LGQ02_17410 [Bacillus shivajii]